MLVVIDLQEAYLDTFCKEKNEFRRLLRYLKKRIREAKESKEIIINLTHFEDGCTIPEVLEMYKNYKYLHFLGKDGYNGAECLSCFLERKKIQNEEIYLSGAFLDICILDTWKGLRKLGYRVMPVDDRLAMATTNNWRKLKKYPKKYRIRNDREKGNVSRGLPRGDREKLY